MRWYLDNAFEQRKDIIFISNDSADIIINEFNDCILFSHKCEHKFSTLIVEREEDKLKKLLKMGNLMYIAARSSNRSGTRSARSVSATYIIIDPAKSTKDLVLQVKIGQLEYKQMLQDEKDSYSNYLKEREENRKACIKRDIEDLVKEKNEWSSSSSDRSYHVIQKLNDKLEKLRNEL